MKLTRKEKQRVYYVEYVVWIGMIVFGLFWFGLAAMWSWACRNAKQFTLLAFSGFSCQQFGCVIQCASSKLEKSPRDRNRSSRTYITLPSAPVPNVFKQFLSNLHSIQWYITQRFRAIRRFLTGCGGRLVGPSGSRCERSLGTSQVLQFVCFSWAQWHDM